MARTSRKCRVLYVWVQLSATKVVQRTISKQGLGKQGRHTTSWTNFGRIVSLPSRPRSTSLSPMLSQCCCMGAKPGEQLKADEKKLDTFLQKSLRWIFKIHWPMRITNEEDRQRAGIGETLSDQVSRRRWTWLGHVLRMDYHSHPRIALTWVPEGKRKRGRPRETRRRTVEREIKDRGLRSWSEAATAAKNRISCKERACGPIPHQGIYG